MHEICRVQRLAYNRLSLSLSLSLFTAPPITCSDSRCDMIRDGILRCRPIMRERCYKDVGASSCRYIGSHLTERRSLTSIKKVK